MGVRVLAVLLLPGHTRARNSTAHDVNIRGEGISLLVAEGITGRLFLSIAALEN
jgi:hypothetical protein